MKIVSINQAKQWLKTSDHPAAKTLFKTLKKIINVELPAPKFVMRPLYSLYMMLKTLLASLMRILFWTPLLKGRVEKIGTNLNLYGGLPYISGPLRIRIGDN